MLLASASDAVLVWDASAMGKPQRRLAMRGESIVRSVRWNHNVRARGTGTAPGEGTPSRLPSLAVLLMHTERASPTIPFLACARCRTWC